MTDAMLGLSLLDISNRLGITFNELFDDFNDDETQVKLYYNSGRAKGQIETNRSLYELAKNGSAVAKNEYDKKLTESNLSNSILEILNS